MAWKLPFFGFPGLICACLSISVASVIRPVSDTHRSAALELFVPVDGSFPSLEEAYQALRTFQILGLERTYDISHATCPIISEILGSSSKPEDLFHALRVNSILGCQIGTQIFEDVASRLLVGIKEANSLMEFYYSVLSLLYIKQQGSSIVLLDADVIFDSIKAHVQSDGRYRYDSDNAEPSTHAAGIALETLAGVLSLADSHMDQSKIEVVKNDIVKLFDSIKSYDDGTLYFDEKRIGDTEYRAPLATTASVVHGVTAFAAIVSGKLKADVMTVFGSAAPPLTVNLVQVFGLDSEDIPILENKELQFDPENSIHYLDLLPLKVDVGKYILFFEISLHDPDHLNIYATGGRIKAFFFFTGIIKADKAAVGIFDTDAENAVTLQKLDLSRDNTVSLAANHLKKMRLNFQLLTPLGHTFKPHQVFLKLRHESKVEHIFALESSAGKYKVRPRLLFFSLRFDEIFKVKITFFDFLGLVEKFYYLSGRYDIELAVGDAAMENSFLRAIGHIDLDLPGSPEKAACSPPQPIDPYSRYAPKQEISHIFRAPEKRPPQELSFAFLVLTFLPLVGFLIGLLHLGVNLKGFPSSSVPGFCSILFHGGIGAILLIYVFFWLKLDLFTTLEALGLLGVFLIFVVLCGATHRSRLVFSSASALSGLLTRCSLSPCFGDARSLETLAFEEIQASEKPVNSTAFVLHGLLGSGRNWRSFSRDLAAQLQKSSPSRVWRMVLVDMRNHGRSAGLKGLDLPHDMVNAAKDLANLVKSHGWAWPDVVIGHSMGGKVALEFAASVARGDYGELAVLPKQVLLACEIEQLWVLDSVPGEVNSDETSGEVEKVLLTLQSLPSPLPSRNNLKNEGEHVVWAFDLQACIEMFNSYREKSYWPLLEHPPKGLEIAIVQAENSDRWTQHVIERLDYLSRKEEGPEEGKISLHVLPKSGHWVHVDNPKGLLEIVASNFYSCT
ncbi:Oligosaccharyltransferase subunit Ribophorin II [Musa troglodytarum]|uniref:Ribophorin II n=1 Tax=Musa troglodytarum TaxID=320322 RepID=A0A9E7I497_9LILI|nr:Oligosaccharyltransferase subunit Ribophorin II [Musa troglodytarum]